jgi:hypothetical protein
MEMTHQIPGTAEWHAFNVGMLITQLQVLEFSARVAIRTEARWDIEDLRTIQPGTFVPEDPVSEFPGLAPVLSRLNERAPANSQVDVAAIVNLRDQLAHGRLAAIPGPSSSFPLTLLKFGGPQQGQVPLLARIEMTDAWFREQRDLVDRALRAVGTVARSTWES